MFLYEPDLQWYHDPNGFIRYRYWYLQSRTIGAIQWWVWLSKYSEWICDQYCGRGRNWIATIDLRVYRGEYGICRPGPRFPYLSSYIPRYITSLCLSNGTRQCRDDIIPSKATGFAVVVTIIIVGVVAVCGTTSFHVSSIRRGVVPDAERHKNDDDPHRADFDNHWTRVDWSQLSLGGTLFHSIQCDWKFLFHIQSLHHHQFSHMG